MTLSLSSDHLHLCWSLSSLCSSWRSLSRSLHSTSLNELSFESTFEDNDDCDNADCDDDDDCDECDECGDNTDDDDDNELKQSLSLNEPSFESTIVLIITTESTYKFFTK